MNISVEDISISAGRLLREAGSPDVADESGWACAWLQACGYPGLELLFEALDTTPPEARHPQLRRDTLGLDLQDRKSVV